VVDEALSVGDAEFKRKCRMKINELIKSGVTVLFVSHSKEAIAETCSRAIFLKDGKVKVDGTVDEAFEEYGKKPAESKKK
jgi:teichoic acid transport system ATP-binding protein